MPITQRLLTISFYLLPFLLPAYLVRLSLGAYGTINLLDIFQLIVILLFLINWKSYFSKISIPLLPISLLFLSLIISVINQNNSTDLFSSLGIIKSYFLLPMAMAIIFAQLVRQQLFELNKFWLAYFFYASVLGLGGVYYLLARHLTFDGRLEFIFNSPNFLAMALAPGILIGLGFITKKIQLSNWINQETVYIFMLIQLIPLLATRSLGAILGLLAGSLIFYFSNYIRPALYSAIILSVISVLVVIFLPWLLKITAYSPSVPATSFDSRIAIYQSASVILKDNWLFGIGPGNFQTKYLSYQPNFSLYPQWAVPHSHNLLLHLWVELGLLGFAGFIFLLVNIVRRLHMAPEKIIPAVIIIYFLIHGLFDMPLWKNDLAQLYWIIFLF